MSRRIIISWSVEFASLTAIAILLSTASAAAKWWAVLPSVLIIGTKITEYRHNRATHINIVQYQLEILLTLLPSDGATVRCTYHRPVHGWFNGRTQLTQSFDYIPAGGGGGRPFPANKGIIGKAYANKEARVENFASDQEYRDRMIQEYNYTISEIMQRSADRRSYLCFPVIDENHAVLGLLYFDSDHPHTFTLNDDNPRWLAIRRAGEIIRNNVLASS